jgi:NADPH:quinone reductase-like Zn-dependent oxidoreductase
MDSMAERIAKLSPEKRALFLQKIKTHQQQDGINSQPIGAQKEHQITLSSNENFCVEAGTPGNFASFSFRTIERIPPGPDQIQVKAKAIGLNFRDLMIALGIYPPTPNAPSNMGTDYAGIVTAVSEGVDEFQIGDEVIALSAGHLTPDSHFSAYTNVYTRQAVHKPRDMSFEEAAGIPTVFLTVYYALHHQARLAKGECVLIHSATGGVGLAALQVAQWCGAKILATAGTPEKREYLKSLGISNPMDSRSTQFVEEVMKITDGEGVDVILNSLPGKAVQNGLELLKVFGRFIQLDKKDVYQNSALDLRHFNKGLTFSMVDLALFLSNRYKLKVLLSELINHFYSGTFKPLPHRIFPVKNIGDALTYMSQAKHVGKIVISYDR